VVDVQGVAIRWSLARQEALSLRHTKAKRPYFAALDPKGRYLAVGDWGYFRGTLATTLLGDYRTHDMHILAMDGCELLRDIWKRVPLLWQQGQFTRRPVPQEHPCLGTP